MDTEYNLDKSKETEKKFSKEEWRYYYKELL